MKRKISAFILPPYAPDLNFYELAWHYIREIGAARVPLMKGGSLLDQISIDLALIALKRRLVKSSFHNESISFAYE